MKYIRTKDGIVSSLKTVRTSSIVRKADTIEELCDEFVIYQPWTKTYYLGDLESVKANIKQSYYKSLGYDNPSVYGAIWIDKGLIYVAKMNEEGVLCLLG